MSDSITCPKCGKTSYNPNDVFYGYCGNCHEYTSNQHVTTAVFDMDEYGEVINSPTTYESIAWELRIRKNYLVGWTDEEGTHFDLVFTLSPKKTGNIQRGLHVPNLLFVSIIGIGAHGFDVKSEDLHPGYVGEKFRLGENVTTERLTDLINGVRRGLNDQHTE